MALTNEQGDIIQPAPLPGTMDSGSLELPTPDIPTLPQASINFMEREQLKALADPEGPFAMISNSVAEAKNREAKQEFVQKEQQRLAALDQQAMAGENQGTITPDEQATAVDKTQAETNVNAEASDRSPYEQVGVDEQGMPQFKLKPGAHPDDIQSYYDAQGSPELGEMINNPSVQGLVQTTSPIEFLGTGTVVAGKLAGAAGLKLFMATSPLEGAAMLAGEEVGEDNWLVGLGIEMAFGVGAGMAGEAVTRKLGPAANAIGDYFTKAPGQRTLEEATLAKNDAALTFANKLEANINAASDDMIAEAIALPTGQGVNISVGTQRAGDGIAGLRAAKQALNELQDSTTEVKTPTIFTSSDYRYPANDSIELNWKSRTAVNARAQVEKDVIQGDLRNPVVKQVYKNTVEDIPEQSMSPVQAAEVQGVKLKIVNVEATPPKAEPKLDTPVAESGRKAIPRRVEAALQTQVSRAWWGDPITESNIENKVKSKVAASKRKNKDITPADARAQIREGIKKKAVAKLANRLRHAGRDPKGAEALYNKKRALGQMGEQFQDDLNTTTAYEMERLAKAGTPANYFDVLSRTEAQLIKVYNKGVKDEVNLKAKTVNAESFLGQKQSYVRGGLEDPDARFPTPQGGVVKKAQSFAYEDWDIVDHMEVLPDSNTILFDGQVKSGAKPTYNTSKLFDYSTMGDSKQLYKEMNMFIGDGFTDRTGNIKKGKFTVYGPAEKLKTEDVKWKDDNGKVQSFKILPDSEMEAIGKLFGWGPSKVVNYQHPTSGFQLLPEQIIQGRAEKLQWDVTNPGYFDAAAARQFEEVPMKDEIALDKIDADSPVNNPKARALSSADKIYKHQRFTYIVEAIRNRPGLNRIVSERMARSTSAVKANKERNAVNFLIERIAVMRNKLTTDMIHLENSADSRNAKKSYLMFQDLLSGSDSYYAANRMTRDRTRSIARAEVDAYGTQAIAPADTEARIVAIADRDGLSMDDATDKYYEDMFQSRQLADDLSDAERQVAIDVGEDSPVAKMKPTREMSLSNAEELASSDQFAKIEDAMGSRFVDDLYSPSVLPGQDGRINLLRTNTVQDLADIVNHFDRPAPKEFGEGSMTDLVLDDLDPEELIGITPYKGHSQTAVNKLTTVIADVQDQTHEAAQILSRHPDNPLMALAFEKTFAIESAFTTQLANGMPSANSLDSMVRLDFAAADNATGIDKVADAVKNSYPVSMEPGGAVVDTRVPLMQANMYLDMETAAQRGNFTRLAAAAGDEYKASASAKQITKMREELSRAIDKACKR